MKRLLKYSKTVIYAGLFASCIHLHANNEYRVSSVDGGMPYLLHLPEIYNDEPGRSFPTIIFLHGFGERCSPSSYGTTNELSSVENAGGIPPRYVRDGSKMKFTVNGKDEYFILISPQVRNNRGNWYASDIVALLDEVSAEYRVDPNRVYLTGFSFGGSGVWNVLAGAENTPNRFAAAAVVAGRSTLSSMSKIAEDKVAVWSLSGLDDPTEHTPERVLTANRNLRGNLPEAEHLVTLYPGVGHSSSRQYNTGHTYHDPNMYEWFLSKTLQTPGLQPRTNLADRNETTGSAGDEEPNHGWGRVKNNVNTYWSSTTSNYADKWVQLDLGDVYSVDQIYVRFAWSTSASIQPVSPHGSITSVEASPTSGRIRIYAPNHGLSSGTNYIPADQIWLKDTNGYDGGAFSVRRVNSSSSNNPDGWFEVDGTFSETSTGTWYTLNETVADYTVEGSADGSNWSILADIEDNYEFNRQHKFEAMPLRYIRLNIEKANRMELPGLEDVAKVYEIKVLETLEPIDPPGEPSTLNVTDHTSGGISLAWDAASGQVEKYNIFWSTDGNQPASPQDSVSGSLTSYSATGLAPETIYTFWVTAYNSGGESAAISVSQTTDELLPPAAPTGLSASGATAGGITLSWQDLADNEDSYLIYASTSTTQPGSPIVTLPADTTSAFVDGLSAGTHYYFWVTASNIKGESAADTTDASTLDAPGAIELGLISQWKLDELSGTTTFDTQGLSDGELKGNATRSDDGIAGRAVLFDGDNDWVEIPHKSGYSNSALSISMWVRPAVADSEARGLISKRSGLTASQRSFGIFSYTDGNIYIDLGDKRVISNYLLNEVNAWKHIAMVFDGAATTENVRLYVDGAQVFADTISLTSLPEKTAPITIGIQNTDYGVGFSGLIDEVRIYDRPLTADEVEYLFQTEPGSGENPSEPSYNAWSQTMLNGLPSSDQAKTADPDHDGVSNLLEYGMRSIPTEANTLHAPVCRIIDDNGSPKLEYSFRRIPDGSGDSISGYTAGGVVYHVLVSPNLQPDSWISADTMLQLNGTPIRNDDDSETVKLGLKSTLGISEPLFIRLQIEDAAAHE